MRVNWKTTSNAKEVGTVSTNSPVFPARQAHNPASAGSRVQIPPPQLILWRCSPQKSGHVFRVYVIQNPVEKFNIGISEDVENQLRQHNKGVSKWTESKDPWTLRWT